MSQDSQLNESVTEMKHVTFSGIFNWLKQIKPLIPLYIEGSVSVCNGKAICKPNQQ